jgi:hypothetical protein
VVGRRRLDSCFVVLEVTSSVFFSSSMVMLADGGDIGIK